MYGRIIDAEDYILTEEQIRTFHEEGTIQYFRVEILENVIGF
jgi:hypothetical protein